MVPLLWSASRQPPSATALTADRAPFKHRVPSLALPNAVDVLSSGTFERLPHIIKVRPTRAAVSRAAVRRRPHVSALPTTHPLSPFPRLL